mmetsp:Transcript_100178/g.157905  ORF Transcript_100178/g.157905 Transcript_100178/m.157905 type:complete len:131 (-) Transcript_100178:48-440(-)
MVALTQKDSRRVSTLTVEEREAWRALEAAKQEHDRARSKYVSQFSLLRRAFKDLGSRTKAYRETHIAPKEEKLASARARWSLAVDTLEAESDSQHGVRNYIRPPSQSSAYDFVECAPALQATDINGQPIY